MIWIIGGTKDSRDILEKIVEKGGDYSERSIFKEDIIVSTATGYGGKLLEEIVENSNSFSSINIFG